MILQIYTPTDLSTVPSTENAKGCHICSIIYHYGTMVFALHIKQLLSTNTAMHTGSFMHYNQTT